MKKIEKLYFRLWAFLRRLLSQHDGRIWNWAGDGGIVSFTFKNHITRAVLCALEIQSLLRVFNLEPDKPIPENISVRIGIDSGNIKFMFDTGKIVSDTINFAAHLEKEFTPGGGIAVSDTTLEKLPPLIADIFKESDTFENRKVYFTVVPCISSMEVLNEVGN